VFRVGRHLAAAHEQQQRDAVIAADRRLALGVPVEASVLRAVALLE
jgi:hypothetical protein